MTRLAVPRCCALALLLVVEFGLASRAFADPVPIIVLDSLGGIPTSTVFDVNGSSGSVASGNQWVGPIFTVPERFVLTGIGAFANLCNSTVGDPSCRTQEPLTVQIRPALQNGPDMSNVIASLVLSSDNDPLHVSFETASARVALAAGQYFALFGWGEGTYEFGYLLGGASSPFQYSAGGVHGALVNPAGGHIHLLDFPAALRIEGVTVPDAAPVPEPSTILLVGAGIAASVRRTARAGIRRS